MDNPNNIPRFHLAFPMKELEQTLIFYHDTLGCETDRSADKWIDFNFFGHQVVAHVSPEDAGRSGENEVDGHAVPASHFGVLLAWEQREALAGRLKDYEPAPS